MKRFFFTLSVALLTAGMASAQTEQPAQAAIPADTQTLAAPNAKPAADARARKTRSFRRFQVGLRGGVQAADYSFRRIAIGDADIAPGRVRAGYSAGLVVRFNLSRHLHIQSEFNYDFVNYSLRIIRNEGRREVSLRAERFEIPLELGFQFGPVRLFGGPMFRVAQTQRGGGSLLKVGFNDDSVGLMGGVGLNIRKFFLDFRMSGYPGANVWNTITYDGISQRVKVSSSIIYGGSIGFYF